MARIVLNQANVRAVGQAAGRRAVSQVVRQALPAMKRAAPRSPAHLSGSGRPKPGERLSEGLRETPMRVSTWAVEQRIESRKTYTMAMHEGSRRHRIPSRTGGKVLKFKWRKQIAVAGGRRRIRPRQYSYFTHVMHPGNRRPIHFMTTPLATVARANNFHYRSNFVRSFS